MMKEISEFGAVSDAFIRAENEKVLASYVAQPDLIEEQARLEMAAAQGAYGRRQIYELVQNGADALRQDGPGAIEVLLARETLYCANEGAPLTTMGARAILHAYLSPKVGEEIGRYGLGFKSVLGVSDRPEVHSAGVSFRFDPDWTRRQIEKVVPEYKGPIPKLRLAKPIESDWERKEDLILDQLLEWATTVVKLPLTEEFTWLQQHLRDFPVEFLLFCPHVSEVRLEDHLDEIKRRMTRSGNGPFKIDDGSGYQEWRTFSRETQLSEAAKTDGGIFAGRDRIRIQWAVPTRGATQDGKFWAYFPLEKERMSLKGALNAPWKLNDDRQNILDGLFNEEAIEEAARLVLENLPQLVDKSDPGKILELMPARLAERAGADKVLTQKFYDLASDYPTVPDTNGRLQKASGLALPPPEKDLPAAAIRAWAESDWHPSGWAHASTLSNRERSARLDQLLGQGQMRQSVQKWLEALIPTGVSLEERLQGSRSALIAAAAIVSESTPQVASDAKRASIVLCSDGETLAEPVGERVYLPRSLGGREASVQIAHPALAGDVGLLDAFQQLGISEVDASSELRSFLSGVDLENLEDADWNVVWKLVELIENDPATEGRAAQILRNRCEGVDPRLQVHVRTLAGEYGPIVQCLLPGDVVPEDGSRDSGVAIDPRFHASHLRTLTDLGAIEAPTAKGGLLRERWFSAYRDEALEAVHIEQQDRGRTERPHDSLLRFDQDAFAGPIAPLAKLSPEGRAQFTKHLLLSAGHAKWTMAHRSRRENYPVVEVDSPEVWAVKRLGMFNTSRGLVPFAEAVGPVLSRWSDILPVADLDRATADAIGMAQHEGDITLDQWNFACSTMLDVADDLICGRFLAACASAGVPRPERLRCRIANRVDLDSDPVVTRNDSGVVSALEGANRPYIVVAKDAEKSALVRFWELTPADRCISVRILAEESAEPVPLIDLYSGLRSVLPEEQQDLEVVASSSVRREIVGVGGIQSENVTVAREGRKVYHDASLEGPELLDALLAELDLPISPEIREDVLFYKADEERRARMEAVRAAVGVPAKLLAAVGPGPLRQRIPESAFDAAMLRDDLSGEDISKLYLGMSGIESLHELRDELAQLDFGTPQTWAGSHAARKFVKGLGFPPEYAGFSQTSYPPAVDVEGPRELPPLHDYQAAIVERMVQFMAGSTPKQRGVLSLPTGAGKTRVAVEAVTSAMAQGSIVGPVLWVAPTKELCDQAVQSWAEVWTACGPRAQLRINRLYGGNQADPVDEGFQVVVAIIDKLTAVRDAPDYEWLGQACAVIVDEAHHSVTPEYTALLRFVGADRRSTRCPIIGLSATPYRGGEQETRALVARYDHNRFDEGILGEHPYIPLQDMGVLARVEHKILEGMDVQMESDELSELRRLRTISAKTSQRIASNEERNRMLIRELESHPADWPILVFGVSVEHSRALAAALNVRGVPSAAVYGEQPIATRRYYIEKFRKGEIRVLCNYNVLTTGFDAPATRAVIVARPTFSPSLYQQMIGRGLRGPKNGGKDMCLLVTVRDNFVNYGEELAFHHFEYLWKRDGEG